MAQGDRARIVWTYAIAAAVDTLTGISILRCNPAVNVGSVKEFVVELSSAILFVVAGVCVVRAAKRLEGK